MTKPAKSAPIAQKAGKSGAPESLEAKPSASAPAKPSSRRTFDWEAIERDYRTGRFTLRELEAKHGADNGLISRKAKNKKWTKDLSKVIKQATKAKLVAVMVEKRIAEKPAPTEKLSAAQKKRVSNSQQEIADTVVLAADTNVSVILGHRKEVNSLRALTNGMLAELQHVGCSNMARVAELLENPDMTAEQLDIVRNEISKLTKLPARINSVVRLTQAVSRIQQLERTAFGLDTPDEPPPVDELADLTDEELDKQIEAHRHVLGR